MDLATTDLSWLFQSLEPAYPYLGNGSKRDSRLLGLCMSMKQDNVR